MNSVRMGYLCIGVIAIGIFAGCSTFRSSTPEDCRDDRLCEDGDDAEAQRPVGARQKEHFGLLWPPYPRPVGEEMEFTHKYHHAHYWPYPYNCQDREYVRSLSALQVSKGWTDQTTLYEYHFDPDTHKLNHSGRLKLQWILTKAPPDRRQISVQAARSNHASQQRLADVREEAAKVADEAEIPAIALRITEPLGRPAVEADMIRRNELNSMMPPRISYESLPTGAGEGG